jgi:phosphoribosyl 1,2-cyclic phosphate phosphodiesterase
MRITILGSGTSHGIPVVGCDCAVCRSDDSRDKRCRASVFIEGAAGERLLIDTGPEFRLQAVGARIRRLDALFFTHSHADHLHGLDDVRPLTWGGPLPVYGNPATIRDVRERFRYIFEDTQPGGGKPKIAPSVVYGPVPVTVGRVMVTPLPVRHGDLDIYGWKVVECGAVFVYVTDASFIPDSTFDLMHGADCLVIGALRVRPHPTHFSFDQAVEAVKKSGAKEAYLTHLCHDHSHEEITAYCVRTGLNVLPAFDGLRIHIPASASSGDRPAGG